MIRTASKWLLLFVCAAMASPALASPVEVRFHPATGLWWHDVDAARNLASVVVQNAALVNRSDRPVTISQVRFDVLRADHAIASHLLDAQALDAMAQQAAAMQQAGILGALDFQFSLATLLGEGVPLSATRTLDPDAALLIPSQLLAFAAPAQRIGVTALLEDGTSSTGALPLRGSSAADTFRFPLAGRWWVAAGATPHHHHRWVTAQEFALDIARVGLAGRTHAGSGTKLDDYLAWGAPVLAAASGEVVVAVDRYPDNAAMLRRPDESLAAYRERLFAAQDELLAGGAESIVGNHVVLRHDNGLYSVYAHLQQGSVAVEVGQRLPAGELLARLGSSGNSTEPHLHFHVCDSPPPMHCAGVPVRFDNIEIPLAERDRQLQSGDFVETK